ncbi:MAG: serine/threonine protein kinase, partial [Prochlorotrichaceae cyanobacterium]
MPEFPDFSAQGLQIIHELGRNPGGGRVTYLARTAQGHSVVLKQFQFAKGGNWTGFKAIERETQTLRDLKHPGIPRYLGSFETDDGFCLVQEYKEARPLSEPRSFNPDEIKHIATQLLNILVYLQDRIPQVFHRDIKPENVLVSDNLQVYLIDFGFARIGGENLAMSSVAMGTFGFMAPEQTRNLQLTTASDLYGLGLTLVCVIAQLKSHEIGEYVDWSNQLDQKAIEAKIKGCSFRFIEWLNQMVAPDPKKRFPDAAAALEALKPLYVKRTPEVKLSCTTLNFEATKVGEKLSQTITLTNSVPETVLEGHWEVAPHPNDPPHTPDRHPWISFSPKTVQG